MLAILIKRAQADNQISGILPHLVDEGLSILQYADDTLLFMDQDIEKGSQHEVNYYFVHSSNFLGLQ